MDVFSSVPVMLWVRRALPILLGAAGGYAYYRFVGCRTGACPLTGNPWISTLYGAVLGSLWAQ